MTLHRVLLALHIAAGFFGLVLGPVVMRARKLPGLHPRGGELYHWNMLFVCLSAAALASMDWERLRWFLAVAAFSYANALRGYLAAKRRREGWLRAHIGGMGGSYIAMVTALLVVNWKTLTGTPGVATPWPWLLPTLAGSPVIAWVIYQVRLGKRPKL